MTWLYTLSFFFFTFFGIIILGEFKDFVRKEKGKKGRKLYELWIRKAYPWHFSFIASNIKMVHFLMYKDEAYIQNHSLFNHFLDRKSNNNKMNEQKNKRKDLEENYWKNEDFST